MQDSDATGEQTFGGTPVECGDLFFRSKELVEFIRFPLFAEQAQHYINVQGNFYQSFSLILNEGANNSGGLCNSSRNM